MAQVQGLQQQSIVAPQSRVHGAVQSAEKRPKLGGFCDSGELSSQAFYVEYHGHRVEHLEKVVSKLREGNSDRSLIFLCGDSSLDNKYWLPDFERKPAINGYEQILYPQVMVPDIAYWLNAEFVQRRIGHRFCAVNTAVEESTLSDRAGDQLLAQDEFIRENIQEQDILVVSAGGNDVALRPTASTILSMACLLWSPRWLLRSHWSPGFSHFVKMFRMDTSNLIRKVISERRPRCVVACMYYYFDERPGGSWADTVLSYLGYDKDPTKLQLVMREVFAAATQEIEVEGVKVVALPLYEVLDGKDSADYVQRVEPSVQGGQKMARSIVDSVLAMM